ncbi:hypothetical protein WA158_000951 [Blastocystis sp. Blastoise]
MKRSNYKICQDKPELQEYIMRLTEFVLRTAIDNNGSCYIAVSGSSQPKILGEPMSKLNIKWKCVYFFFVDERCVPLDDPESNFKAWDEEFFSKVDIPRKNIFALDYDYANSQEAAEKYEQKLHSIWGDFVPVFDLIFLGMGPDGHTCSLFPSSSLLSEDKKWVTSIDDSPKPPASRITFTYPVLNNAENVFFVLTGENKAHVIHSIFTSSDRTPEIPAGLVKPQGEFIWVLDKDAAKLIRDY